MVDALHKTPAGSQAPSAMLTILVVDDDPDMRAYVTQCLGYLGDRLHQVLEAADGLEALHLARSVSVDLVISDVVMPRLDGYALCKALKAEPVALPIKVLLISGEEADRSLQHAGVDAFLGKPFNAERLQSSLDTLFNRPP